MALKSAGLFKQGKRGLSSLRNRNLEGARNNVSVVPQKTAVVQDSPSRNKRNTGHALVLFSTKYTEHIDFTSASEMGSTAGRIVIALNFHYTDHLFALGWNLPQRELSHILRWTEVRYKRTVAFNSVEDRLLDLKQRFSGELRRIHINRVYLFAQAHGQRRLSSEPQYGPGQKVLRCMLGAKVPAPLRIKREFRSAGFERRAIRL